MFERRRKFRVGGGVAAAAVAALVAAACSSSPSTTTSTGSVTGAVATLTNVTGAALMVPALFRTVRMARHSSPGAAGEDAEGCVR